MKVGLTGRVDSSGKWIPYHCCDIVKPRKWFLGKRAVGFLWVAKGTYRAFPGVLVRNTRIDVERCKKEAYGHIPEKRRMYYRPPSESGIYHIRCDKDLQVRKFRKIKEDDGYYSDGSPYVFKWKFNGKDGYISPKHGALISKRGRGKI